MIQTIVHYDKEKSIFVHYVLSDGVMLKMDANGVLLKDIVFITIPECQLLVRERQKKMSEFDAKFPHAFAVGTKISSSLKNPSIFSDLENSWQEISYNVFENANFFLKKTEKIIHCASYLWIDGQQAKVII